MSRAYSGDGSILRSKPKTQCLEPEGDAGPETLLIAEIDLR
jgi:hypothetical protein